MITSNILTDKKIEELKSQSLLAKAAILKMTTLAASGHPGGSMSSLDFLLTLYDLANIDHNDPGKSDRDRIVISHGHVSPAVFSVLAINGFFPLETAISQFRLAGSIFEGHVEPQVPGVEWASGNLGQGLSAGCGFALACRLKNLKNNVFVLMGDGEQQKGQLSEARRFAVKYQLNNLIGFVDYNKLQISGKISSVMPQNIKENYLSDGWEVLEIDGHDFREIHHSILKAKSNDKPTLILAHTIMGKGVSFMENNEKYHGSALSEELLDKALREIGLPNDLEQMKKLRSEFEPVNHKTEKPGKFQVEIPEFQVYEKSTDCRSAWGESLAYIAENNLHLPIAVFDCDLMGSVKTNDFAKLRPQCFFQNGIMEHNAAVVSGAFSKEGFQTFFADFGVFGVDETYNQHRLNDINNTNLKVITTHVGLDVGEDGKTHQCLDYLGVMRNLYHFKVIIPADPNQTARIIEYISGVYGNFLVAMGRSKTELIRKRDGRLFYDQNYRFNYGKADLLREGDDAALFVMGTLTGRAVQAVDILHEKGFNIQLWHIASPLKIDEDILRKAASTGTVFSYEDHNVHTGLGNCLADRLMQLGLSPCFVKFGVEDYALSGRSEDIFRMCRLDCKSLIERIEECLS
jgi:transketolase